MRKEGKGSVSPKEIIKILRTEKEEGMRTRPEISKTLLGNRNPKHQIYNRTMGLVKYYLERFIEKPSLLKPYTNGSISKKKVENAWIYTLME